MTSSGDDINRGVIVVVDYHSHLPPAIEVAISLANRRRLALRGLFVEDPTLASVSSLPFSQEVTLAGARPREFKAERLNRTLQVVNRRFQQLLSKGAEQASLEYSFGRIQGRHQAMELTGERDADYLVLGQPRPLRSPDRKVLCILLVQARMAAALPVLESLQSVDEGREIELLLINGNDKNGDEGLQALVANHPKVFSQRMATGQLEDILRPVGHTPELVITSRQCNPRLLDYLLKLAACPVILSA